MKRSVIIAVSLLLVLCVAAIAAAEYMHDFNRSGQLDLDDARLALASGDVQAAYDVLEVLCGVSIPVEITPAPTPAPTATPGPTPITPATIAPAGVPIATVGPDTTFVLNASTHKIHNKRCSDVNRIKPENFWAVNFTLAQCLSMNGYTLCGHCFR